MSKAPSIDALDRRIIQATQAGLPLVERPYHVLADIRRIGIVPNHYVLGYRANGMSVWDVPDEDVAVIGRRVGALDFVSHAYHRPRYPPIWPYNLFAMVHGRSRAEVENKVAAIAELIGPANRGHTVLYSTRILKKTGLRIVG
jgi:DNA-binding Lrp family transcriptional regulator